MLLFIFLNPPFVNLVDRHRIEIVQLLASSPHRCDQIGSFETREVLVQVGHRIGISGGGARIRGMLAARRRWTGEYEYAFQDQSSLLGAAILGQISQSGRLPGSGQVTTGVIQEAVS